MAMSKDWDHPWTVDEIVENAPNWNLAGDAGLLKHLEQFSENLFERVGELNGSLVKLMNDLDRTSINLDLVKNQFLSLQNTQFIESRVYEDDETLDSKENNSKVENKVTDDEKRMNIKNAVLHGIELIDKYYDKVTVDGSDSEDEVDCVSYVLQPKNPYLHRPLPYVIGTEQWYKNLHVGLEDSSSEEEEEEPDKYSDTDSESNLPVTDRRRIESTSDSGTDVSINHHKQLPVINDTDSSSTDNSIPVKAPPSNQSFADQLAARLGNVIVESTKELEINRRPINTTKANGGLFTNEPPPLEDSEEDEDKQGMFSGGRGLFDDSINDSESFWGQKISSHQNKPPKVSRGLFDESDDENIFSPPTQTHQKSFLKPFINNVAPSFISDEPPEVIHEPKVEKKPPVGGVSVFGGNSKFGAALPKRVDSSSDNDEEIPETVKPTVSEHKSIPKKPSLFDEPDDLFKDDLFSNIRSIASEKKKVNLFEDDEDESFPRLEKRKENLFDSDEDIFTSSKVEPRNDSGKKTFVPSLFDDAPPPDIDDWENKSDNNDMDEDDIYDISKEVQNPKKFSIFDDEPPDFDFTPKKITSLFDDVEPKQEKKTDISINKSGLFDEDIDDDLNFKIPKRETKKKVNLFPNDDVEKNSIFNEHDPIKKNITLFNEQGKDVEFEVPVTEPLKTGKVEPSIKVEPESKAIENKTNIFEEHLLEDKDDNKKINTNSNKKISLFDDEIEPKDTSILEGHGVIEEGDINSKTSTNKKISLFDDEIEPEDMFSNMDQQPKKKVNLFEDNDLFTPKPMGLFEKDVKNDEPKVTGKPVVAPRKVVQMKESLSEASILKNEEKVLSPRQKLKHNLNINVTALMPGAAPPKNHLVKSQSLEDAKIDAPQIVHAQSDKDVRLPNDHQTEHLLPSITKSRARIAVKRRPSTRRGRQESIKRNREQNEDQFEDTKNNNVGSNLDLLNRNATQSEISQISDAKNNGDDLDLLDERSIPDGGNESGPMEYEDFLNDSYTGGIHKKEEKAPKASSSFKTVKGLFDDDDDDEDIFADIKKAPVHVKKNKSLFDDDADDVVFKKPVIKHSSLFDDISDDDDDIFSSKKSIAKAPKPVEKKRSSKTVSRLKGTDVEVLDDPLDLFSNQ